MSRRGGGGSARSGAKNRKNEIVKVSGYVRSNGTCVAGYTRSAPRNNIECISSGSESDSEQSGDSEDDVIHVRGYTRSDGTYVPGYTRAAPQRKTAHNIGSPDVSCCPNAHAKAHTSRTKGASPRASHYKVTQQKASCSKNSAVTSSSCAASGYMPAYSNRPRPLASAGYSKAIPDTCNIKKSTKSGQAIKHTVQLSSYPRPATGKTAGNNIKSNESDVSSGDSGTCQKCYIDNAYNRKLGRVGKPLRTCIVRKEHSQEHSMPESRILSVPESSRSQIHKRLLEENKLEDLVQAMKELQTTFQPHCGQAEEYCNYQYAIDRLQRDKVEESWRENCVEPSRTNVTSLQCHYPENQIPFADLELERVIGRGGFGEVYAARLLGKPVAFKKLLCQQMPLTWKRNFSKEVTILATTHHPNIVKMLGYVNEENSIGIVMEYLRCSLYRAVFIESSLQDVDKKKTIISQIACALHYLHTRAAGRIAHCDIKSENVLLDWSDNALLCDFGLSALKNSAITTLSSIPGIVPPGQGTPRYSAPEVLRGELLTMSQLLQADIYSLAIVVFEVMTEEEPFEGLTVRQLEVNVGHGNMQPTSARLSQSVGHLLTRCWDRDAGKRLTATEFQEAWSSIIDAK